MNGLSTVCACGHMACYHPSLEQQAARLKGTNGRYAGECKGGAVAHCRCVTAREVVQTNGDAS